MSWTSLTFVRRLSSIRLDCSKDWMKTGARRRSQPDAPQRAQQLAFERQPERPVVGGVLGLGVDADPAAAAAGVALGERDHLLEGRDPVPAVELLRAVRERLDRAQGLDLGEREVGGEPALVLGPVDRRLALAARELGVILHIGRVRDVRLVTRDQLPVLRGDEVGLDVVGAGLDGERVARQRVIGEVAGGPAVTDHQRVLLVAAAGARRRRRDQRRHHCNHQEPRLASDTSARLTGATLTSLRRWM